SSSPWHITQFWNTSPNLSPSEAVVPDLSASWYGAPGGIDNAGFEAAHQWTCELEGLTMASLQARVHLETFATAPPSSGGDGVPQHSFLVEVASTTSISLCTEPEPTGDSVTSREDMVATANTAGIDWVTFAAGGLLYFDLFLRTL